MMFILGFLTEHHAHQMHNLRSNTKIKQQKLSLRMLVVHLRPTIANLTLADAAHATSPSTPRHVPSPRPRGPCATDPASRVVKMKLCRRLEGIYHYTTQSANWETPTDAPPASAVPLRLIRLRARILVQHSMDTSSFPVFRNGLNHGQYCGQYLDQTLL